MLLKLKYLFSALAIACLFASCGKETSYENGGNPNNNNGGGTSGGTAAFTLSGAPGNCTSAALNGGYTAGVALNDANTVTISVDVNTAGTYTISTGIIDGISFDVSGTFTTTGPHNVTLLGTGTPTSSGTFTFNPGTNGCSFSLMVN